MKKISAILTIILAGFTLVSMSQNCNDYILKFSNDKAVTQSKYRADPQSKSGLFKKGQSHTLNIVFSEGKDYVVKFYNSVPQNKVTYKMTTESGEVLYNYDNFTLQKQLKEKEEELKQKQKIVSEGSDSKEADQSARTERNAISKEVGDLKLVIDKDKRTVPSVDFSITATVNCIIEVTLEDAEPTTPTSCIATLILTKPSEGPGFADDTFSKVQKELNSAREKANADAKAKAAAAAQAKADADAANAATKKKKK